MFKNLNTYCVIGPPGCGKTYSIAKSIENNIQTYGETGIIVCSLTKTAAKEASGRVGLPREQVGTLHSFAYRAIGGGNVAESHIDDWNSSVPSLKVSDGAVNDDLDDQVFDTRRCERDGDDLMSRYNLLRARCVPEEAWPSDVRMFGKKWREWKDNCNFIDFADMIEIATQDTITAPGNPYLIYMDEAQDSSVAESRLLAHWGRMARKVVVVGDPMQSLYEWRGATPDEFFPATLAVERKHILAQSYRVPESVRDVAVRWASRMPGFQPAPYHARLDESGATVPGSVEHSDATLKNAEEIIELAEKHLNGTVMILTSCGYMLNGIVAALRAAGLPFHNPYRRKQGAWNPLHVGKGISGRDRILSFLEPKFGTRLWTIQDVQSWASVLKADDVFNHGSKTEVKEASPEMEWPELSEKLYQWFKPEIMEYLENQDLKWWYENTLPSKRKTLQFPKEILERRGFKTLKEQPKIIIGTTHSVKGGEADTVIVAPDLSRAGYEEWDANRAGVYRLFYVAMTRAREKLILLSPSSMMAVEW
jgi:DNA helicase II / ATP-dependent DNA helicase PcrA